MFLEGLSVFSVFVGSENLKPIGFGRIVTSLLGFGFHFKLSDSDRIGLEKDPRIRIRIRICLPASRIGLEGGTRIRRKTLVHYASRNYMLFVI